jgi:uncharacterized SAM-binding protein YcdF (DUF218 family)
MMFVIKKIVSAFLLPPGLFVMLLAGLGAIFLVRKKIACGLFNLILAGVIWALATAPVADRIMAPLEQPYSEVNMPSGDVIVLLGGGIAEGVPDFSGRGAPSAGMLSRIVTAVRLQRRLDVPIVVSGGRVYRNVSSEAMIARRFLTDLGVAKSQIITEERSRDTRENARFTKELCRQRGFKKPILLTSAYHLPRAVYLFEKAGLAVTAFPAGFKTAVDRRYGWQDLLPSMGCLDTTSKALHEYLGLLYYRLIPVK